jgi:hypothetical protein
MSDIHFGRCPIADEAGYQEFIVLHLPQVTTLDGISITKETQLSAEDLFYSQVSFCTLLGISCLCGLDYVYRSMSAECSHDAIAVLALLWGNALS